MGKPTIALLGRPNVGKSTLFNRLVGSRKSIVQEAPGVTRDRIYGEMSWNGRAYHVIDTGGYMAGTGDEIVDQVRRQAELAGEEADLILLIVDGEAGVMGDDSTLADQLRKFDKPVLVAVNKIDDLVHEDRIYAFYELGLGNPVAIGALGGRAVGDLLDLVEASLTGYVEVETPARDTLDLAIVGVPNVGKSSFLNALIKEEKSIVTDIPGTTRDTVDSYLKYMGRTFRLIDTAGLRRKSRVTDDIEFYSTVRTNRAIDECDVAVVMVDAARGFHMQDQQIMADVWDRGKGLVVAVNKWDTLEKIADSMGEWVRSMTETYKVLENVPLVFTSVHHNQRLRKVLDAALETDGERRRSIGTAELNRFLETAVAYLPPPATRGKLIQIKYVTQVHHRPPLFAFFCNHPKLIPVAYKRYLENRLRESFGFKGVPIKLSFRQK